MRYWFATLLLLLVVSNAMVAAHAAAHVSADASECELCAAYTNPPAALAGHSDALPAAPVPAPAVSTPAASPSAAEGCRFHARAPPSPISLSR